jgi:hypothetical protein
MIRKSLHMSGGPIWPFTSFLKVLFTNSELMRKSNQGHSLTSAGQWLPRIRSLCDFAHGKSPKTAPDNPPRQKHIASQQLLSTWLVAIHIRHFVCISLVVLIAKEGPQSCKITISKQLACLKWLYTKPQDHPTRQNRRQPHTSCKRFYSINSTLKCLVALHALRRSPPVVSGVSALPQSVEAPYQPSICLI